MKQKRLIALLLTAVLLLALLAGCGKTTDSSNSDGSTDADGISGGGITFPLAETVTLTLYSGGLDANLAAVASSYGDNEFFKELERRTNVHIEFITPAQGNNDAFNLMIASDELPDIINQSGLYSEGYDAAVEDGVYLDLTPYLDTYLKDYNKVRTRTESIERDTRTDAGRVVSVFSIAAREQAPWYGLMIRKDWLDDLGLDVPHTASEWETVLQGFKDEKGAVAPLGMINGIGWYGGGYNCSAGTFGSFSVRDGKVVYNDISDDTRAFVKLLNGWYEKGLIDQDYTSKPFSFGDPAMIASGQTGAWMAMYTTADTYAAMSDDPDFEVVGVLPPMPDNGEQGKLGFAFSYISNAGTSISADCKNKEVAMAWLNYLFTEEGSLLANYGIEGDTYVIGEDGEPQFTEKMTNNPEGMTLATAMSYYTNPSSFMPCDYAWYRELAGVPQSAIDMCDFWAGQTAEYNMPSAVSLTSEELREYSSIYTDINTQVSTVINQFVTGVKDVDTEWDAYVAEINSMGIDRCIEIYQGAYDRYMSR